MIWTGPKTVYKQVLPVYAFFLDRSISAYAIAVPIRFLDSLKNVCAFILCLPDSDIQYNSTIVNDICGQVVGFLIP